MPAYKLYYFPLRARAELPRLVFAAAGVEYEDVRITFEDWPKHKQNMSFQQVPVLDVDGKQLAQGYAIARYLATEHGLAGKDKWEVAEADMYTCAVEELFLPAATSKVEAIKNEVGPRVLPGFEAALAKSTSGYLVGSELTYADLALLNLINFMESTLADTTKELLSSFPNVLKHQQKIESLPKIAAWISKRPKSDM